MANLSNPSNTFRPALYPYNKRYCSISASVCRWPLHNSSLPVVLFLLSEINALFISHPSSDTLLWANLNESMFFLTKGQFMSSKLVLISSLHTASWWLLFANISRDILFVYKDVPLFVIIWRQSSRVVRVLDPVKDLFVNKLIFTMSICN